MLMDQQTVSWVFSGVGITVILSILKFIFVPYPIINITLEEKAFLTGYQRFIRRLFLEFSAMLILIYIGIFSTSFNNSKHPLKTVFPYIENLFLSSLFIFIIEIVGLFLLILFLVISFSGKLLTLIHRKSKQYKSITWLLLVLFVIYIIILNFNFGYIINWILSFINYSYNLQQKKSIDTLLVLSDKAYFWVFIVILIIYVLYRLLLQPVISIFNKITTTFIVATITLTDGSKLYNKYILRPSVDGNILIGDKPKPTEDCNKIMLPKTSILIIEFKRIYKSIENHETTIKRILLPPDFK